jgi:hypothetical protein
MPEKISTTALAVDVTSIEANRTLAPNATSKRLLDWAVRESFR